jgi:hypothetical protein
MRSRKVTLFPWMGILLTGALLCSSSCALLFPDRTAPKSSEYKVTPPSPPWQKLAVSNDPNSIETMRADMAYENPKSGAIISLNSICRKYNKEGLEALTENLVRGIGDRKVLKQEEVQIDGATALDTLYEGTVDDVFLNLRTVVLIKGSCTFDFIYVSVPKRENGQPHAFDDFLATFHTE